MNRLLLVRHGQTEWNAAKVLQGQADIALSERGREQARALAPLVARWRPAHAICSDLQRARQTAGLLGFEHARLDARWREADLGQWTSRPVSELLAEDAARYQQWRDGQLPPPGGESFEAFRARVAAALADLQTLEGDVLVVTHGGVIRAVLTLLLQLTAERLVAVDPGSLSMLDMSASPRLLAYNHTPFALEAQSTD